MQNWQNVNSYAQLVSLQAIENKSYLSEEYKQKLKNQFTEYNNQITNTLYFDYLQVPNLKKLKSILNFTEEISLN